MIEGLTSACIFLAAACSALAAFFWYHAAQLETPSAAFLGYRGLSLEDARPNAGFDASSLVEYAQESGRRNKVAAAWSAAAAACAGIGWALGLLLPLH